MGAPRASSRCGLALRFNPMCLLGSTFERLHRDGKRRVAVQAQPVFTTDELLLLWREHVWQGTPVIDAQSRHVVR
jgi:hypothetical protein